MSDARRLAGAVGDWLATLDAGQRASATFAFDDPERFVWAFTPGDRDGLALRDMTPEQRVAAMRIVDTGMSARGGREIADVIALETTLGQIERDAGRGTWPRRDPELYWFGVFGEPSGSDPWMWRVGGHHVAVHMTVVEDEVIGSSPSFLGANPAVVPAERARGGYRALSGEETLARELLASLSPAELAAAVVDPIAPPEILTSNSARADARSVPRGLRYSDMAPGAQSGLERLIRHYLGRSTENVAAADWGRAVADGLADTTFAWAGSAEPGHGHYYAVCGQRLLIEYDNTQNGANHIHAVWHDLENDWGEDLLAAHYGRHHAAGG